MGNWDFFFSVHALERFFVPILLLLAPAPLPIPPPQHNTFFVLNENEKCRDSLSIRTSSGLNKKGQQGVRERERKE
jgi:hypothetical protein